MRAWRSSRAATLPLPITPSSRLACGAGSFAARSIGALSVCVRSFGESGMVGGSVRQRVQDAGQPGFRRSGARQGEFGQAGFAGADPHAEPVPAVDAGERMLVGQVVAQVNRLAAG